MRKTLFAVFAVLIFAAVSFANTTMIGSEGYVANVNSKADLPITSAYNPVLDLTMTCYPNSMTPMEVASDGDYWYAINGGNAGYGVIVTYTLAGDSIGTVFTNLDSRSLFFNPNDGLFYHKNYGMDLHTIDPATGSSSLVHSNIFHDNQSKVAYQYDTNYMYEMVEGTVYVIDLTTGSTVNTLSGFNYGGWGTNWCIATNQCHLFTWDGNNTFAYDFDGNLVETFDAPQGSQMWSFSLSNSKLWASDYSNWNGHSGMECGPCCDVDMTPDDDPVIVDPGGQFGLTGYIGNPTDDPIVTDVWGGVIYLGNFYQQFSFPNISLNPGQSLTAHTWQNVPNFAPAGTYDYIAYCGDRPDDICDSAMFPFTVTGARNSGGAEEWFMEGEFPGYANMNIVEGIDSNSPMVSNPTNGGTTTVFPYDPVLEITIPDAVDGLKVTIASDGEYYYSLGSANPADIAINDLDGKLVQTTYLDHYYRGLFYNENDDKFYIKHYGTLDIMEVDPWTGVTTLYMSGVSHSGHGNFAYVPETNLLYERVYDEIFEIDFETGVTLRTLSGLMGTNWAIGTNGQHLFAFNGTTTIYAYDFDGNLAQEFTVPYGSSGGNWYLSHCNNLLWVGNGSYGEGEWYGYSGVEGEVPCCDVDMTPDDDPVIVEPGGRFGLTGYIGNPTADPIVTDVWGGVIYLGNFYQQFAFNNIPLDPGASLTAHTWQNVPGFA
ncbi:MAG: hypothetical protein GF315_07300, partial [candidate division Zixibacteria bacterium]|nr:hypothetical protein [candidate division Zixibacteria bacterium]